MQLTLTQAVTSFAGRTQPGRRAKQICAHLLSLAACVGVQSTLVLQVVQMTAAHLSKLRSKRCIPCTCQPGASLRCRIMLYDDAEGASALEGRSAMMRRLLPWSAHINPITSMPSVKHQACIAPQRSAQAAAAIRLLCSPSCQGPPQHLHYCLQAGTCKQGSSWSPSETRGCTPTPLADADDAITPEAVFDVMEEDVAVADLILWVGISFEQSASVAYFRRVRSMLRAAERTGACTHVLLNPSEDALWNLTSACSNLGDSLLNC